jgi:ferric-dicitrate binding protein FerR (iron transport regulator)
MIDEEDPTPEELEAAAKLAASLEDPTAEMIRAAAGKSAPLGELRARALAREALAPRRRRRRWPLVAAALAAVAVLLLLIGRQPERPRAHSAGLLVPGPFPARQSAAERLDLVTADRLIALRESHYRGGR